MRKFAMLGVVMALGASTAVFAAEDVSHSYLEAGYGYAEIGGGAVDEGDGFKVAASWELPANVLIGASYRDFDYDVASITELSAGLGYKWDLGSSFDLVTAATYEDFEFEDVSESGFGLSIGVRGLVTEQLELGADLKYTDIKDLPTTFTVSLGGRWYFNPNFALGLDVRKADQLIIASDTSFIATLRYDFGQR